MWTIRTTERGVTLIEMLIVVAVLSLVLAGIYGLLNSAYQSYNHTRAKLESQQTARIVLDYLVFRLREVDGGRYTTRPERCIDCHSTNMDQDAADNAKMPCTQDVSIPQKAPMILEHRKLSAAVLPPLALTDIPAEFQQMTGNFIQFQADLLPLHGFNEAFTDSDGDDEWDWDDADDAYDLDDDDKYDRNEPELLEDLNDNGEHDYFGETWTFRLKTSIQGPYYELVESVNFGSLKPDITKYNKSVYDDAGYTDVVVAYGITGLRIAKVERIKATAFPTGRSVSDACAQDGSPNACHGSVASTTDLNIYGDATDMDFARFTATHDWWNIAGLSIEVTTTDTKAGNQQFTKLQQFVNFRNLEVNQ